MYRDSAQLREILDDLIAGRLNCGEARTKIESGPGFEFPKAEFVLSFLEHYFDDEDVRRRDPIYGTMQNHELQKLVSRLRQSDYEGAAKVTFLNVS
jgi:hypothetical protein